MGSIGLPELLVILAILALIFGASRLPELGRGLGRGIRSFKDATRDGMNDDAPPGKSPAELSSEKRA
jgi:sec-independent protein translocase protein TatA